MRVILVGTPTERRRLREEVAATPLVVVGEAASTGEARANAVSADAFIIAARHETSDDILDYHEELTPREREVLDLLAQGLSNKAIGARLGISDQTVKFHVASLSAKLGASNRTSAVRLAIDRGLVTL